MREAQDPSSVTTTLLMITTLLRRGSSRARITTRRGTVSSSGRGTMDRVSRPMISTGAVTSSPRSATSGLAGSQERRRRPFRSPPLGRLHFLFFCLIHLGGGPPRRGPRSHPTPGGGGPRGATPKSSPPARAPPPRRGRGPSQPPPRPPPTHTHRAPPLRQT